MITQELLNFIKSQVAANKNIDAINQELIANNWQQKDIDEAFLEINQPTQAVLTHPSPVKKSLLLRVVIIIGSILLGGILIVVLLDVITAPTTIALSKCFQDAATQAESDLKEKAPTKDKTEVMKRFCIDSTPNMTTLTTCLSTAKNINPFATMIVEFIAPINKKIDPIIQFHNTNCPDSPIRIP